MSTKLTKTGEKLIKNAPEKILREPLMELFIRDI